MDMDAVLVVLVALVMAVVGSLRFGRKR